MNKELLAVAKGNRPADLVVKNGKIVNVYSGEIYDGGVAVCGDTIAAVGNVDYCIGENTKVIDAQGNYITPGFLDGHIHPESSSLAIRPFAEGVLLHGTTGIMTDLHEIGVVSGLEGIEAVLKEAEATDLKIYFVVPSHVPFAPNLETSGGKFDPEIIRKALSRKDAVGLSECVGHYILAEHPELMESGVDTSNVSIVTDDLHTCDLKDRGHLDDALRTAFGQGLGFLKGIQFVTINAARAFQMESKIGSLTPGRRADINITTGAEDFKVLSTIAGGKQVSQDGKLLVHYEKAEHDPCILNTVHFVNPITADSFKMKAPAGAKKVKVLCMDTLPYIPFTSRRDVELNVVDGVIQCDTDQDVLYIAQVERHGKNGNIGKAFMGGFHIKGGALASSVGHDNHNIIVMGDSFEDMALAVNRCAELGGGQVIVRDGKVAAEVAYPICGLMSDLSLDELAAQKKALNQVAYEMGTPIAIPFMFLCFICLACIEAYAVTDKGFIDVEKGQIIDPVLEVIE